MSDTSETTLCSESTTRRAVSDIAEHLEFFLKTADEESRFSSNAIKRPAKVRHALEFLLGDIPLNRLAYQPLPRSFVIDPPLPRNWSLVSLMDAAKCLPSAFSHPGRLLDASMNIIRSDIQFMTLIDAAAYLPVEVQSSLVRAAVYILRTLQLEYDEAEDTLWRHDIGTLEDTTHREETISDLVHNCRAHLLTLKLQFYNARLRGESYDKALNAMEQASTDLGSPARDYGYDVLTKALATMDAIREETWTSFHEDITLEWAGTPIPVEDVSTPLERDDDEDCIICQDKVTPPGVRTSCQHTYCRSCLETWIHAAKTTSHMCCMCRVEIFPKPEYRIVEDGRDYDTEIDWIGDTVYKLTAIYELTRRFWEEVDLENKISRCFRAAGEQRRRN